MFSSRNIYLFFIFYFFILVLIIGIFVNPHNMMTMIMVTDDHYRFLIKQVDEDIIYKGCVRRIPIMSLEYSTTGIIFPYIILGAQGGGGGVGGEP